MSNVEVTTPTQRRISTAGNGRGIEGKCIFTVDVEDWFHILELPTMPDTAAWGALPSRVSRNFHVMLDIFDERKVHVTCFFLGWVAEQFPELVRAAADGGHEIASHGYSHRLIYEMTPEEFLEDIGKSKQIIEDIACKQVIGYRAPGISVTSETPWFFDKLAQAGHRYDSSIFPGPRQHGGYVSWSRHPSTVETPNGPIEEFPVSVSTILGRPMCFFGGGYLRLAPYALIKKMGRRVLDEQRPVIFYVHPREIDPDHPRMQMNAIRRFKSYVNLDTTRRKIDRILKDFSFTTFNALLPQAA